MTNAKLYNIFVIPIIDQPPNRVALLWTAICQLQRVHHTSFEKIFLLQFLCICCSTPSSCWKNFK